MLDRNRFGPQTNRGVKREPALGGSLNRQCSGDPEEPEKPRYLMRSIWVMVACLIVGLGAGGAGHGTMVPFTLFFPFAAVALPLDSPHKHVELQFAILAIGLVAQFPLYGFLLAWGSSRGGKAQVWLAIGIIHLIGLILAGVFGGLH